MKKLLSLLTALLMLLSFTSTSAESAMESTINLTLDSEAIGSMMQLMGGMTSEEELALVSAVLGMVNQSSAIITAGGTGVAFSLRLKDAEAAEFLINASESGITLTSSMFPGYALAVSPELLRELADTFGLELPALDMAKAMELLIPYGEDISLALEKIMAEAKIEEGTFTPDGTATYTQCRTISLTTHTVLLPARGLVARLQQDKALLQMLEPFLKMAGEGVNLEEQLASALSQLDAMLAQEPAVLAELRLYTNTSDSFLRLESANLGDIAFLLTLRTVAGQDGSSSLMRLTAAEGPVADWDAATRDIRGGLSTDGLVLDGTLDTRTMADGAQTNGSLQILGGELNADLTLDSFAPTDTSQATVTKISLGLGGAAPLAVLQFSTKPVSVAALAEPEGKTTIAVHAGMREKDFVPLITEVIGIGLPRMMIVMTEQMPEVMNTLLTLALSKARESSIVPERSVLEPEAIAVPETGVQVQGATGAPESAVPVQETAGPGKLTVAQASFQVTPYSSYYQGTVYARLVNSGTAPVEFESGTLELLDASGNVIGSEEVYDCYPEVLEPGETGYLYKGISVEAASEPSYIEGYNLTVNGREEITKDVIRLPSSGKYEEIADDYWTSYYLSAAVENESDELLYDAGVVFVLKDAAGNLLYITQGSMYGVGIMPHASVSFRTSLYSDALDYFKANSLVPATVDTIAYTSTYR